MDLVTFLKEMGTIEKYIHSQISDRQNDIAFASRISYLTDTQNLDIDTASEILLLWDLRNKIVGRTTTMPDIPEEYEQILANLKTKLNV